MGEQDPQRRAALYRLERLVERDDPPPADGAPDGSTQGPATADRPAVDPVAGTAGPGTPDPGTPDPGPPDRADPPRPASLAARRTFADELVRQAMARGDFDDLPLTGKPIPGLTGRYDPDWWLKAFIEREQITGVLPEALQLRKDDAALDDHLDELSPASRVREAVQEFNARVVEARRQLLGGPPVVTPTRDVDAEVARWERRRAERLGAAEEAARAADRAGTAERAGRRGVWWRGARRRLPGAGPR